MHNPTLLKTYTAAGAIEAYRIVKLSNSGTVAQASSATDPLVGIVDRLGFADGDRLDVIMTGIAECEAGGAITIGDYLTADAQGRAVSANAPAVATESNVVTYTDGDRVIGMALDEASTAGEIISVILCRA